MKRSVNRKRTDDKPTPNNDGSALTDRMIRLERSDGKKVAYDKNQFFSLLMSVSMFKSQLEIDYEEYLNGSMEFNNDFKPTEHLTNFLEMAENKFDAYCHLSTLKKNANFIVKALLARHYNDDEYINTIVMTHFDMLEIEIIKLKSEIADLTGEEFKVPVPNVQYLSKKMNEINQECPEFFENIDAMTMALKGYVKSISEN